MAIDNYEEARSKLSAAQYTSDLQSQAEEDDNRRASRKKRLAFVRFIILHYAKCT